MPKKTKSIKVTDKRAQLENTANAQKLWLLNEMEQNGGKPDVVGGGGADNGGAVLRLRCGKP